MRIASQALHFLLAARDTASYTHLRPGFMKTPGIFTGHYAILGGTFDPVHNGHLGAAAGILDALNLKRVIFMPTAIPAHKNMARASFDQRLDMLNIAVDTDERLAVSDLERTLPEPSYTIHTVRAILASGGSRPVFATGADAINDLGMWKDFDTLLDLCRFVVVTRPGYAMRKIDARFESRIEILRLNTPDTASSIIRRMIYENRLPGAMLPHGVFEYIRTNRLYLGE